MIYNILLKPDVGKEIKTLIDFVKQVEPLRENIELEIKFKQINGKNISKDQFDLFLNILNQNQFIKPLDYSSENDVVYSYGDYREIINTKNNNKIYMKKERIQNIDFELYSGLNKNYSFRLSLSTEKIIDQKNMIKKSSPFIRNRKRYSYTKKNFFRIDLTEVQTFLNENDFLNFTKKQIIENISTSFEIEIEFLNYFENNISLDLNTKYKNLFQYIKEAFTFLLPENHTLVSYDQYENSLFKLLDNHIENKPVNVKLDNIHFLREQKYYVTNKLDGVKYNLLVRYENNLISRIILINNNDIWFLYESSNTENSITFIFDAEVVLNENQIQIYIFDSIYSSLDQDILSKSLSKRLEIVKQIPETKDLIKPKKLIDQNINIYKKTFIYQSSIEDSIKNVLRNMYKDSQNNFKSMYDDNDGIIFQPYDAPYYALSQLKDKRNFIPILKWKFPDKVSIDFKIKYDKIIQNYRLYSNKSKQDFEFVDDQGKIYPLYLTDEEKKLLSDNMIIETTFDFENKQFKFHRIRFDKSIPNAYFPTAKDTFVDMKIKMTLVRLINLIQGNKDIIVSSEDKQIEKQYIDKNQIRNINIDKPYSEDYNFPKVKNFSELKATDEGLKNSINYMHITSKLMQDVSDNLDSFGLQSNQLNFLDINSYLGSVYFSFEPYFKESYAIEQNENNFEALKLNSKIFQTNEDKLKLFNFSSKNNLLEFEKFLNQIDPNIIFISPRKIEYNHIYLDDNSQFDLTSFLNLLFYYGKNIELILIKTPPNYRMDFDTNLLYNKYNNYRGINVMNVFFLNRCLYIYRKYHNLIKSSLINNYCDNALSILDIGAGKGGDLFKYKNLKKLEKLYLAEPNQENYNEMIDRIKNLKLGKKFISIEPFISGGEDTQKILSYVKEKVNVISAFYILTFFFQSEEMLDQLVNTIDSCLDDEGYFIGTTFDGYRTLELLYQKGDLENSCYSIKKLSDLKINTYNNKIEIDFRGTKTATKQTEYLVYLDLLKEKLKEKYIYLEKEIYFDDENLNEEIKNIYEEKDGLNISINTFDDKEIELNRLYKLFIFKKVLPLEIDEEEIEIKTLSPIILTPENNKYIKDNEINKSLYEKIELITHIDDGKEFKTKYEYYRLGCIGSDNNCFFHSILVSNDLENYNSLSYSEKIDCASNLREDTIKKITQELFEFISFSSISYPLFLKEFYQVCLQNLRNLNKEQKENLNSYIFKEQKFNLDITNKILYVIDRLKDDYDINLNDQILELGNISRKQSYKKYINSLLQKREKNGNIRYVKYITNEDIEIINYILNIQVILISDNIYYPIRYTNINYE